MNSLARDGLALLGSTESFTLTDFLQDYYGGDDPGNDSPGDTPLKMNMPNYCKQTYADEQDDEDCFQFNNNNQHTLKTLKCTQV